MKALVTFTLNKDHSKIAIKPFDIRTVKQITGDHTLVTYSKMESDDHWVDTIVVVGSFEDIIEKIEGANR